MRASLISLHLPCAGSQPTCLYTKFSAALFGGFSGSCPLALTVEVAADEAVPFLPRAPLSSTCLENHTHVLENCFLSPACGGGAGGWTTLELHYVECPVPLGIPARSCHSGSFANASRSVEQMGFIKRHYQPSRPSQVTH